MSTELVGQVLADRYRVEQLIGRGGMAEVYKAWDVRRQYYVAVKVMREDIAEDLEFLRRFRAEAETLAGLSHANIVRFYSFERDGILAFLIMDYVPGITLRRRILELGGRPLPMQEVITITRQICAALHYAHAEGMIHRDVKTGNIMIRPDGHVLLSDFGIAKAADSTTVTTLMPGTPAYMSPEQCLSQPLDQRSDIYSLGVVLYEMLAGRRPFLGEIANVTGTTSERVRWEHIKKTPLPIRTFNPAVSPELEQVVLKCLSKKREERYASVLELMQAFERTTRFSAPVSPANQAVIPAMAQTLPLQEYKVDKTPIPSIQERQAQFDRGSTPAIPPRRNWLVIGLAIGGISILAIACIGIILSLIILSPKQTSQSATSTRAAQVAQGTALMATIIVGHQTETAVMNAPLFKTQVPGLDNTNTAQANPINTETQVTPATPAPGGVNTQAPISIVSLTPEYSLTLSPSAVSPEQAPLMITDWSLGSFYEYKGDCKIAGAPCWKSQDSWRVGYDELVLISKESIDIGSDWENPYLVFWHKYELDLTAEVSVKVNDRWEYLKQYGKGNKNWTREALSLSKYRGKSLIVKFSVQPYRKLSHWYLQDIQIDPAY